jgi:hypothetical protein
MCKKRDPPETYMLINGNIVHIRGGGTIRKWDECN